MNTLRSSKIVSFFTEPPERVPDEMRSFFSGVLVGDFIAIFFHIGLIIFWQTVGIREMVVYHFLSFSLFFAALFVIKTGRPVFGAALISSEFLFHGVLGTLFIGRVSGMHYSIILPAVGWAIIPGIKKPFYKLISLLFILFYPVFLFFVTNYEPRYTIDPAILRWTNSAMAFLLIGLVLLIFTFNSIASRWYTSLQQEREKSEHLLLNVLPEKIAFRLKEKEGVIADRFDSVSVLFLDIVNFTKLSADMPPHKIVNILNEVFCVFDTLTDTYGLEKIKTIGDAYMAVAGIPEPVPDHARRVINMAIDMLAVLEKYSHSNEHTIQARIGICSGPVVAGVIGKRKFIYDLWGDTVNTASRMESNGLPNRIQVTQSTYDILRYDYEFEPRGEITIKGKGLMKTYFLKHEAELAKRVSAAVADTVRPSCED